MTVRERRNVDVNLYVRGWIERNTIYRHRALPITNSPPHKSSARSGWLQLMCNNSARSQIRFFTRSRNVTGQNIKHFGRVRRSSGIFRVQVLGKHTVPPVLGKDSEVVLGMIRVLNTPSESKCLGYSAQKFQKTKNNVQNVVGLEPLKQSYIRVHRS